MENIKNKRRTIIVNISISSIVLLLFGGMFLCSKYSPQAIHIKNEEELLNISNDLNNYYVLDANISITKTWKPIGTKSKPFSGTLNGNGHTIMFNKINEELFEFEEDENQSLGLFGYSTGTIIKLSIENLHFEKDFSSLSNKTTINVGAFAGENHGFVTTCLLKNAKIDVKAYSCSVGGLVGVNYHDIRNCNSGGQISGKTTGGYSYCGGIVGSSFDGIIEYNKRYDSFYTFSYGTGNSEYGIAASPIAGAIFGGTISNCYANGKSNICEGTNQDILYIGSIAGLIKPLSNVSISNCYCVLDAYTNNQYFAYLGGVVGFIEQGLANVAIKNMVSEVSYTLSNDNVKNYIFGDYIANTAIDNFTIENCYSLKTNGVYRELSSENTYLLDSYDNLTIRKLKWKSTIWNVRNGTISYLK